jgi:hypothetical protein
MLQSRKGLLTVYCLRFVFQYPVAFLSHLFRVVKGVRVLHMIHNRPHLTTGRGAMPKMTVASIKVAV